MCIPSSSYFSTLKCKDGSSHDTTAIVAAPMPQTTTVSLSESNAQTCGAMRIVFSHTGNRFIFWIGTAGHYIGSSPLGLLGCIEQRWKEPPILCIHRRLVQVRQAIWDRPIALTKPLHRTLCWETLLSRRWVVAGTIQRLAMAQARELVEYSSYQLGSLCIHGIHLKRMRRATSWPTSLYR
jgi:hypothetical protein